MDSRFGDHLGVRRCKRRSTPAELVPTGKPPEVRVALVAGNTFLEFFFGEVLDELREDGAARVHPLLLHPADRQKEVDPGLFQFKSFLLRSCVTGLFSASYSD